jgi:endonuclease YncB( thermonuclease family)
MRLLLALAFLASLAAAGGARADPCEAVAATGSVLAELGFGQTFSGEVVHVIDGDSLCVAIGAGPQGWVEVRLADFDAPESRDPAGPRAKAALERVAAGREVVCVAGLRTYDRVAGTCRIEGRPIGDLLRLAGAASGGRGAVRPAGARLADRRREAAAAEADAGVFRSCAAARAAGAAPLLRGQAGYGPHLDRDGDGIACEPYRGR